MTLYILAEHNHSVLDQSTRHLLSASVCLNLKATIVVIGHHCAAVAAEASLCPNVESVLLIEDSAYEHLLPEQLSPVVASIVKDCSYLLMASTTFGKQTLPRIAALLGVAQISDVTGIVSEDTFDHPIYAGSVIETVQSLDKQKILSIRTTAFSPVAGFQDPCAIETLTPNLISTKTRFVQRVENPSVRPELSTAKMVVSGGRGLQSAEQFKLVETLADALGAAVGASRAAVDAGFISNDHQVGQTGKIVAPTLYIALGISGAIQHIAGIKDSQVIVAINKDEAAPIFQVANYGLVGDLFELVPQLLVALKQRGLDKC